MTTAFEWVAGGLIAPALVALRIAGAGMAWAWLAVPADPVPMRGRDRATAWAWIVVLGLLVNLLVVLALGAAGRYGRAADWGAWGVLSGIGLLLSCARGCGRGVFRQAPGALLITFGIMAATMLAPGRGEWILGGWDPGVYVNEGVALSRTGTLHPPDPVFHLLEGERERHAFSRTDRGRTERFPGVAVDYGRQSFAFQFSSLMPSGVAFFERLGGLRAAVRFNLFAGLLGVGVLLAWVWKAGSGVQAVFTALLLVMQPVWAYHTRTPVSEMLQLFWVLSAGLCLASWDRPSVRRVVFPLVLAAAVLNRFVYLPFAFGLIVCVAWKDLGRADRVAAGMVEHLVQMLVVAAAGAASAGLSLVSLREWSFIPDLIALSMACMGAVVLLDMAGSRPSLSRGLLEVAWGWRWAWATVLLLALGFLLCRVWIDPMLAMACWVRSRADVDNFVRLLPYLGYVPPVLAVVAFLGWLCLPPRRVDASIALVAAYCAGLTLILLWKKEAADVYPWATRRYLDTTIPLMALLPGAACAWGWEHRAWRWVSGVAILLAGVLVARSWSQAWFLTEYRGASAVLADIAGQVDDADIVVADHPLWGTPLALIHGKPVLNGQHFYRRKGPATMQDGMQALARLRSKGRRIRFLTTVSAGIDLYPLKLDGLTLDWQSGRFLTRETIHDKTATGFLDREMGQTFRLYTWKALAPTDTPP